MYVIIMINIIYIIKIIKTCIFNIITIVYKNIYINDNIEFTYGYRFVDKICE